MINWTAFSNRVNKIVQNTFSVPGTDTEQIAKYLIDSLPTRPTLKKHREEFLEFIDAHNIQEIVHFTRLENVPNISRIGLIPRAHLELKAVRLALSPHFSDEQRRDNSPQANCLSFTSPNYKMFYQKRREHGERVDWAVISMDPMLVADFYCEFSYSNAARYGVESQSAVSGVRKLFSDKALREHLGLLPNETTNPQAEILEDTVVPPHMLKEIYVNSDGSKQWLLRKGILSEIRPEYFRPRRDYSYWL